MKRSSFLLGVLLLSVGLVYAADAWKANYSCEKCSLPKCSFISEGENPYFVLKPGFVLEYGSKDSHLVVTVLNETKKVDGVETRIVEERESKDGKLVEVSRNYFAICQETKDVCYFGEDVDMYKDGKVTDHGGSWIAGVKGAKYGVMIPGKPAKGQKFYQENAVGVAQDRSEILTMHGKLASKAGKFKDCIKTLETTPLEPDNKEYKIYAPGVGLVKDSELVLVRYGFKK